MTVRRAFTLVELLVVIAIIAVLAAMVVAAGVAIAESARVAQTSSRMAAVLNALSSYGERQGGAALNLQRHCALGGVTDFDTVEAIVASVPVASAKPPPFTAVMRSGSTYTRQPLTHANHASSAEGEKIRLWQRLSQQVFDVMPPEGATWAAGDYETRWPLQWPETDWDLAIPGDTPPILRFPWGKPGLRIDGSLCDPARPEALGYPNPSMFNEQANSGGLTFSEQEPNGNSWITFGDNAGGRIWQWRSVNDQQTDWVTLSLATRSGGPPTPAGAVVANQPLPFDMGWMSPLRTIALLQAAGTIPATPAGEEAYRTDRRRNQPWNDAWGRPLVVVYAIFQPERYQRTFDGQNRRDLLLRGARAAYQYNRSIYLAVGAPGGALAPGTVETWAAADDAVVLRDHWFAIREVCEAHAWTETGFTDPPWKDIKKGKRLGRKSLLTGPTELK